MRKLDFLEVWRRVDRHSTLTKTAVVVGFFVLGVVADAITGPRVSMLLLYSGVVAAAAWFVGFRMASAVAVGTGVATSTIQSISGMLGFPTGIVLLNAVFRTLSLCLLAFVVVQQRRLVVMLRDASITDSLTGILNRSGAMQHLALEIDRARRFRRPLSVAYLDLDGLKECNDSLGHAAGDQMILRFTDATRSSLRSIDAVGRMGGDEFLVVLGDTDVAGAHRMLHRLFGVEDLPPVSVGVLSFDVLEADTTADEVIRRVDEIMYTAKRSDPVAGPDDGPGHETPPPRKWRIVEA